MDDYAREMMDLKTLVTRTLEKKGVLAKIRAELRASVFEATEEEDRVVENEESVAPALLGSCNDRAKQLHASPSEVFGVIDVIVVQVVQGHSPFRKLVSRFENGLVIAVGKGEPAAVMSEYGFKNCTLATIFTQKELKGHLLSVILLIGEGTYRFSVTF